MTDFYTNDEASAAAFEDAHHGTRLPYDRGFYGSGDVTTRREAEEEERG